MRKILLTIGIALFSLIITFSPFAPDALQKITAPKVAQAGGVGDQCTNDDDCSPSTGLYCISNQCSYENENGAGQNNNGGTGQNNNGGTGQNNNGGTGQNNTGGTGQNNTGGTGQNSDDCYCPPDKLCNPLLCKYNTACKVLDAIINLITEIGAVIAVILIIWTGFKFITAQGNSSKLTAAKNSFYTTIIGTAVLLGASAIAQIIVKTIFSITNKGAPGIC